MNYKFYQITHHRVSRRHDHWLEIVAPTMRMCEMRCELKVGTKAVKRSIGSTTGFLNHGEGPY